jgi:hypothetical protein
MRVPDDAIRMNNATDSGSFESAAFMVTNSLIDEISMPGRYTV